MILTEVIGHFLAATQNLLLIALSLSVLSCTGLDLPSSHIATSFSSNPQGVK